MPLLLSGASGGGAISATAQERCHTAYPARGLRTSHTVDRPKKTSKLCPVEQQTRNAFHERLARVMTARDFAERRAYSQEARGSRGDGRLVEELRWGNDATRF